MRFSVQREVLLKPLSQVVGVVERRQTLPGVAAQRLGEGTHRAPVPLECLLDVLGVVVRALG